MCPTALHNTGGTKQCPGSLTKRAALSTIATCLRDNRPHLRVNCRLSIHVQGSLACVTCSCGAASFWDCGVGETAASYLSTLKTAKISDAMVVLAKLNCLGLLLPCTRSMMTDKPDTADLGYIRSRGLLYSVEEEIAWEALQDESSRRYIE